MNIPRELVILRPRWRWRLGTALVSGGVILCACAGIAPVGPPVQAGCEASFSGTATLPSDAGAVYDLPFDPASQPPTLSTSAATDCGPPLVLADAPEQVSQSGLTAEAPVTGTFELFYYQRTGATSAPLYFLPTVINRGKTAIHVTVARAGATVGATAPTTDMLFEDAFLKTTMHQVLTVPPNGWVWLDPSATEHATAPNGLAVGQFLLATSGPATVAVVATPTPANADPLHMQVLPIVHNDSAGRGLFPHAVRWMSFAAQTYPVVFPLDRTSKTLDPYITGTDPATGLPATDVGNYGVLYQVHIALHGTPGTVLGVFLAAGGPGRSQAEADVADVEELPGHHTVMLPADNQPPSAPNAGVLMTTVTIPSSGTGQVDVRLLPPSGLDALMHIVVLPMTKVELAFPGA